MLRIGKKKRNPCYNAALGVVVHHGFTDTGKRENGRSPGYEVWVLRCACGKKKIRRHKKAS